MINNNCPNCISSNSSVLYDLRTPKAHFGIGLPGTIKKCQSCNLIYKTFNDSAEKLYNDSYAEAFIKNEEYTGKSAILFFEKILKQTYIRLNKNNSATLLDIGSGIGILLDTAKKVGFTPTGVELSAKLSIVAQKKGHEVINVNINDSSINRKFDTITMMDIIEHLEDPNQILRSLKLLLNPNGELIVYTPNHDSLLVKIAHLLYLVGIKSPIENIFACTHTCFFTTKTLADTLTKAGYTIIEKKHFNYDTSRPGQKVSYIAKIGIYIIETIGSIFGFNGFRIVMYVKIK